VNRRTSVSGIFPKSGPAPDKSKQIQQRLLQVHRDAPGPEPRSRGAEEPRAHRRIKTQVNSHSNDGAALPWQWQLRGAGGGGFVDESSSAVMGLGSWREISFGTSGGSR